MDIDKNGKGVGYYAAEKEVLLMPYFMFTVMDIKKPKEEGGLTIVECQEIPFQNQLELRPVCQSKAIWADPNYDANPQNKKNQSDFKKEFGKMFPQ